jgi:hypothetical protein
MALCTPSSLKFLLKNEPDYVKQVISEMLEYTRGVELESQASNSDLTEMSKARQLQKLRELLTLITR